MRLRTSHALAAVGDLAAAAVASAAAMAAAVVVAAAGKRLATH
jgi:hypothetical protein